MPIRELRGLVWQVVSPAARRWPFTEQLTKLRLSPGYEVTCRFLGRKPEGPSSLLVQVCRFHPHRRAHVGVRDGETTAILSIAGGVLLRPMTFPDPG